MPKIGAAERREKKQNKAKRGMRVSNRNIKTVLLRVINEKIERMKNDHR
jgi:uncharacterized lipoprotein YajG